jgi:hypothetical protein
MYLLINWACYVQFGCENVHRYVYTNTHENTHTLASSIFQVSDKLKNEEMSKQSCISSGILKNPGWRTDSSQCCLCTRDYVCHGSELLICMWHTSVNMKSTRSGAQRWAPPGALTSVWVWAPPFQRAQENTWWCGNKVVCCAYGSPAEQPHVPSRVSFSL